MMRLDERAILALCRIEDPTGVVSIYASTPPDQQASSRPPWMIEVSNLLGELRAQVKEDGPRDRWVSLHKRLDSLESDLNEFLSPRQAGRGRAMFVPVEGGEPIRFSLQLPLPTRVVFESRPYIKPLVAAHDEGRPAGVVAVHKTGVQVDEWSLGELHEVAHYPFDAYTEDWRHMRGPAASNPAMAQHAASQRDNFERRLDSNRHRFFKDIAEHVKEARAARGWDRVVVLGGTGPNGIQDALEENGFSIITGDYNPPEPSKQSLSEAVEPLIREAHRAEEVALVEEAVNRAAAGGPAAAGVQEVCTALGAGQVSHLLIDADAAFDGFIAPDGRLFAQDAGSDVPVSELIEEPHLAERMIERALETGAKATPVEEKAAAGLAEFGGAAALLRW